MLREILMDIFSKYDSSDTMLQELNPRYLLCLSLDSGSPYLKREDENEELKFDEKYVNRCVKKAEEIYSFFNLGSNLLVVYDDMYNRKELFERKFVESCLIGWDISETYTLNWSFPIDEKDPPHLRDEETYTCSRNLYKVKSVDTGRLFREIVLSDIGGEFELASSIYIIDIDSGRIFWLYDDRGLDLISPCKNFYNPKVEI